MYSQVSNENLNKLKELSEKICANEFESEKKESNNTILVEEIKKTIDLETAIIDEQKTNDDKLNCYEKMFQHLKIMLGNFKIS